MRLMIVGSLNGQISTAGKMAISRGAKVTHCEDTEQAMGALRNGKGADIIMVDVKQDIASFIAQLEAERIVIPVVACGIDNDTAAAVKAIKAGAKEYIPLPPDAELIAAVLQAIAEESNAMIANDPSMKAVLQIADRIAPSDATVLIDPQFRRVTCAGRPGQVAARRHQNHTGSQRPHKSRPHGPCHGFVSDPHRLHRQCLSARCGQPFVIRPPY